MATALSRIYGTNNAYEFSETLTSTGAEVVGEEKWIPANVGQLTGGIVLKAGTGGYKIQVSFSTREEVEDGIAEWFDWQIPGVDANGWIYDAESQFWCPVPSHVRCVTQGVSGTSVYFSMRAN